MALALLLAAGAAAGGGASGPEASGAQAAGPRAQQVDGAWVRERARALAARPYEAPSRALPEALQSLDYDAYRAIRFRPEAALWRQEGLPFEVQLFHPGFLFREPVALSLLSGGRAFPVRFSSSLFEYGATPPPALPDALGVAGFRVHYPLNRPDYRDELVVFLGASYFRSLGAGQGYGLSARGLAIDTALPSGEEFPAFREFWLETPAPGARAVVVHALLDSPSLSGAWRFVIHPGPTTVMEVEASLFPRRAVRQLGLAPLTSMYLHGENDRRLARGDFRPEVHDSDGLFLWTREGERLWRPLLNPERMRVSLFQAPQPRAFGLLQRDGDFASYQDLEARYERRPSVWVEPVGEWGAGAVELVELPTAEEIHDNVVAFWVPATPLEPGREVRLAYRLHWGAASPFAAPLSEVVATRVGQGSRKGATRFVVDFSPTPAGARPTGPLREGEQVAPVVWTSRGRVLHAFAQAHPVTGGWRASFELEPGEGEGPVELRLFLREAEATLSETWSYQWTP